METLKKVPLSIDQLAYQLVKYDLTHCQLIYGLLKLEVNAEHYLLRLPESIFMILGFGEIPEPLWNIYFDFVQEETTKSASEQDKSLDQLASEVLDKIKIYRKSRTIRQKQAVIKDLIKQDLIYSYLLDSLYSMQINVKSYKIDLKDIVFEMMGLKGHKKISEIAHHCASLYTKVKVIEVGQGSEEIDELAAGIYYYLLKMKKGNIPIYDTH